MSRPMTIVLMGVAAASVINYIVVSAMGGIIPLYVMRVVIAVIGGWLLISQAGANLWTAAAVGPFILVIDHVVLTGGFFLYAHFFVPQVVSGDGLGPFAGVLVSFLMLAPVAATCSLAGGYVARRKMLRVQRHS